MQMDLKSGYPFWAVKNGLMHSFARLESNQTCEVAVIGGGITGALIANELGQHGHDVVVLEQRDIAWGSTAASTALLQYEIDTPMLELARRYGEKSAALAYRSCAEAIPMLQRIAGEIRNVGFARAQSLYYASRDKDVEAMQQELALRKKHGFDADWLNQGSLWDAYKVRAPGAILTRLAAYADPYRMTYGLLARLARAGARIYDRTRVNTMQTESRGVVLCTDAGMLRARHVVVAAGYATQKWLKARVATNRSSYAFITDPLPLTALGRLHKTMVWESARPYLYMRSTPDRRLLVGGEDDAIDLPAKRDACVQIKTQTLMKKLARALPGLVVQPTFSWAGTFAETADGLPFFGKHPQYGPRVHFAMAYGGNGITYSMLGAHLIRAEIEGRKHPLARLFSFRRLQQ